MFCGGLRPSNNRLNGRWMMLIGCPKETAADEKRVALTPDSALQIQKLGYSCVIETGAGDAAGFTDGEKADDAVGDPLVTGVEPRNFPGC